MSTAENLSYQGELPGRVTSDPGALALVSTRVAARYPVRYPRKRGVAMTPDDVAGELALRNAVLALLLDDARAHLAGRPDPSGIYRAACLDVLNAGPMTHHVARFCLLDPEHVRAQFRRYAAGFAVAGGSHEGVSLPVRRGGPQKR